MKRLFSRFLMAALAAIFLCGGTVARATTLTGTVNNPDGSAFNGTIFLTLSQAGTISSSGTCGGPVYVPNTYQVAIQVVAGAIVSSPSVYDSQCFTTPGIPYSVQLVSSTGQTVSQVWVITSSPLQTGSENVGTIVPVTTGGGTFVLPPAANVTSMLFGSTSIPLSNTAPSGSTNYLCVSSGFVAPCTGGSGGSMTWPAGGAGIPNYNGSSAYGTSYSASNLLPATFLPKATGSTFGVIEPDGTSCTVTAGVLTCPGSGGGGAGLGANTYTGLQTAPGFVATASGGAAGTVTLPQGTAPSVVANAVTQYAPSSVTGYLFGWPAAPPSANSQTFSCSTSGVCSFSSSLTGFTINSVTLSTAGPATAYLDETGNYSTPAGGGGSMTWPSGGAGIPNYNGSSAYGTSYSASNLLPATFLPKATTSAFGAVECDGTTITCSGGVITASGGAAGLGANIYTSTQTVALGGSGAAGFDVSSSNSNGPGYELDNSGVGGYKTLNFTNANLLYGAYDLTNTKPIQDCTLLTTGDDSCGAFHNVSIGSAPSVVVGAAAGTGASVSFLNTPNDNGFAVSLLTGTSPTTSAALFTLTFAAAWNHSVGGTAVASSYTPACTFSPIGPISAALTGATMPNVNTRSATGFVLSSGSTALAASTQYYWAFTCE